MSSEIPALFDVPESLSPRLAWLRQHGLTLKCIHAKRWECSLDEKNVGHGDTPDTACIDFCLKTKLPHWNQL